MSAIFATPVATRRTRSLAWAIPNQTHKRKRSQISDQLESRADNDKEIVPLSSVGERVEGNVEYSVSITPAERNQRRVAGQTLNQEPPPSPFPHVDNCSSVKAIHRILRDAMQPAVERPKDVVSSLHMQHLAALTAIIQRSILRKDWPRASRALGLLFREAAVSSDAAVRTHGYMNIAAEVLLNRGSARASAGSDVDAQILRQTGFSMAKRFYDRLAIRHPYQKSWPDAVNAIDFHLAMFNIWIYIVNEQFQTGVDSDAGGAEDGSQPDTEVGMLQQAIELASKMDALMTTVPFMDEPEFIRLRAMVGLWLGDLYEAHALSAGTVDVEASEEVLPDENDLDLMSLTGDELVLNPDKALKEARTARELARDLLSKLSSNPGTVDDDE
jgi:hypothetical protein